jgi:hypothetical protein
MVVAVCRALTLLCVAPDTRALATLKSAAISAEWELAPGATDERDALDQIDVYRPQMLVVFGPFEQLLELVRERFPGVRIIADRDAPGASEVATSLEEVRGLVKGLPRPGGPVSKPYP